jgi:hypothetical protein
MLINKLHLIFTYPYNKNSIKIGLVCIWYHVRYIWIIMIHHDFQKLHFVIYLKLWWATVVLIYLLYCDSKNSLTWNTFRTGAKEKRIVNWWVAKEKAGKKGHNQIHMSTTKTTIILIITSSMTSLLRQSSNDPNHTKLIHVSTSSTVWFPHTLSSIYHQNHPHNAKKNSFPNYPNSQNWFLFQTFTTKTKHSCVCFFWPGK